MAVLVVGLNHDSASLSVREQLHFNDEEKMNFEMRLTSSSLIKECVVLSTCNRTEIYAVTDRQYLAEGMIKKLLLQKVNKGVRKAEKALYVKVEDEAVRHLFTVVCGLDSLVIGETQILGQVKDAFFQSQKWGSTGTVFNWLFKQAITLGKKAHTATGVGEQAVSVSSAAVHFLKEKISSLGQKQVLIIGAGTMSKLTAQHLMSNGCRNLLFANRTFSSATELADIFSGNSCTIDDCFDSMHRVDIVICSVDKRSYLIHLERILGSISKRKRPLYLIDLGVPRNIDPDLANIENVHLYDLDHFKEMIDSNCQRRIEEGQKIKGMIKEELEVFNQWKETLPITSLLQELQENALRIEAEAFKNIENKLPDLTDGEKRVIQKFTKMISSQLIRQPILALKEIASKEDNQARKIEYLRLASQILGLESEWRFESDMKPALLNETLEETGS